ncbi:MAG: trehalose-phosphatase [Hyphomicrobiaceae bacterium]
MRSAIPTLDAVLPDAVALFLDFDGTLTPIVARPDEVHVDAKVLACLTDLLPLLDGALAIVSGRQIAELDRFLYPHLFPASGVHGFEQRMAGAGARRMSCDQKALQRVTERLSKFVADQGGLLLEKKPGSVALHYRARPDLSAACRDFVAEIVKDQNGLSVIEGKMVIEIKGHRGDKGSAIRTFLKEPPFIDRLPVFLGDDTTDEAGFLAVNTLGGVSIKIGHGETLARYRLKNTSDAADWLAWLVDRLKSRAIMGESNS